MRKSGNTFLMIGLIASICGFVAILVLLIYNLINKLEFLSDTMRMQLRMAAGYLLVVSILSAISINSISKGLHIAGIVICAISLYQTFGVVTFSLVGFIIKAIDITNLEKGQQRRNENVNVAKVNTTYMENENTVQNYKPVSINYRIYVRNHIGSYIVSIIFSLIYLGLYGYGFYELAMFLFGARDGVAIAGGLLFIMISPLLFLLLGIIIAGLIAPILAIASPDEKVLKYNIKMASLSLTFINGYASKNILNQIDIDNRNSTRY
ncbi:MAG: hypothetical protein IKR19_05320 [Acholeplasmatales bacterium]|nr:hypothetical protein [Acholeplasmatales bacterium]